MAGDYTKFQRHYGAIVIDFSITGLIAGTTTLFTARNASYQIFVQKTSLVPTIYAAAVVQITDTAGKLISTDSIPATEPALGAEEDWLNDFGPTGTPLTIGASLQCVVTPVGFSGILHIEAYQRLAAVIGSNSGAANQ